MHKFPGAVLGSEDAGHAKGEIGEVVTAPHLGSEALDFHDAGEIVRDVSGDGLEPDDLTVPVAGEKTHRKNKGRNTRTSPLPASGWCR